MNNDMDVSPACRRWALGTVPIEDDLELSLARKRLGKLILAHDSRVLDCTHKSSTVREVGIEIFYSFLEVL